MLKRADAVKFVQVEWKERIVESEDWYVAALSKTVEMHQDKADQFIFNWGTIYKLLAVYISDT